MGIHWTRFAVAIAASIAAFQFAAVPSDAQESLTIDVEYLSPPQQRDRTRGGSNRVYKQRVAPQWIRDTEKFWYRNDLADGAREYIFVDPAKGTREFAFDHIAVSKALDADSQSTHLPIDRLIYSEDLQSITFLIGEKAYLWNSETKELNETEKPESSDSSQNSEENRTRRRATGSDSAIIFENKSGEAVEVFWVSGDGAKQSYGKIAPGTSRDQHTFGGHRWSISNSKGDSLGEVVAFDDPSTIVIDGKPIRQPRAFPSGRRSSPNRESRNAGNESPDGKWKASIVEHNVTVTNAESGEQITLSTDGVADDSYGQLVWSKDSKALIGFREKSVERLLVNWVRSSPPGGGRAVLETKPYVLPGDPFPSHEINLFNIEGKSQIKPATDRFESEWSRPQVRLSEDGATATYEQIDRGHQRFRLIEINLSNGEVRNIIDEKTKTFLWTAHSEGFSSPLIHWLQDGKEIIYATEKNGWRQLILIDVKTGQEKRVLTPAGIVVRGIDSIDEAGRTVWFTACGREGQDPYHLHQGYVQLDTGKLVWLTEGNGTHTVQFTPKREYVLDSYSRVDQAPVTELRRVVDGGLVCELEKSDTSELEKTGWVAPEVFSAKGRDGQTDIWGIICRPKDFDPAKKYPVIEDIYAGPHNSHVPKTFSPSQRFESLTSLGFIVVKIDGMGTANRSKAFHDVCWQNIKDAGFEDRILWMKAAAEKHPELDLERVGIYGTSAGGQNAAAAVLFHPEFYKVAVAACGCHDNRMDKASWNEQWMGYPVGEHYAACSNIDNAHRLGGKLFLIVGEMDTNVPPESTMRFVDALIRADKDFDLLVVPNGGHGMGGNYGSRRMHDYFVKHL